MDPAKALKAIKSVRDRTLSTIQAGISLTSHQAPYLKDAPTKGPVWVSRVNIPADGDHGIIQAIEQVIAILGDGSESYDVPRSTDIEGEWVGHRSGADASTVEPKISEEEKYQMLTKELGSDSVLFYAHGGAGYGGSKAASRPMTSNLAALSRSRVFAFNYRLCPQSPFPTQLVDVLLSYLYLLYPPPGSLHSPVPASKIVFVGDSFGAVLFLALTQVLLTLRDHPSRRYVNRTIRFRGQDVHLHLPAGLALASPYSYTPEIFPSWEDNLLHDWFPVMRYPVISDPMLKFCEAWPTKPLRGDLYCDISMLGHPLVCLSAARSWQGCPPIYMASGQERTIDSAKVIANQAARDGVTVCWEEYEGMPHTFMTFFPQWKQSKMCYERWVAFARECVMGGKLKTNGIVVGCIDLKERSVDVETLSKLTPRDASRLIEKKKKERSDWLGKLGRAKSLL